MTEQETIMKKQQTAMTKQHTISPLLVLIVAFVGVGVTELSAQYSLYYWAFAFVVICGLFSYEDARNKKDTHQSGQLSHHVIHWFGALIALSLIFLFVHTGNINLGQAGLFSVLLLAFAVFSDGIRVAPRYVLVGVYLFLIAGAMAYLEEFLWWFLLLSVLAICFEVYWIRAAIKARNIDKP